MISWRGNYNPYSQSKSNSEIIYAKDESYTRLTRHFNELSMPYHFKKNVASMYLGKKIFAKRSDQYFYDKSVEWNIAWW